MTYIPQPIVQQTNGNSIVRAIEAERKMAFEKKLIDANMEYQRSRDAVNDAKWDKDFDLRKSQAKTREELLQAQIVRLQKSNQMIQTNWENAVNAQAEQENWARVAAQHANNNMAERKQKEEYDKLKEKADNWFSPIERWKATKELEAAKRKMEGDESGRGIFDWMGEVGSYLGGVGDKEYQGVAEHAAKDRPEYTSSEDILKQATEHAGGMLSPRLYNMILGQDYSTMSTLNNMPNEERLQILMSMMPTMLMRQPSQPQPNQQFQNIHNNIGFGR